MRLLGRVRVESPMVEATERFVARRGRASAVVHKGALLHRDHEIVRLHPEKFRPTRQRVDVIT